MPMSKLSDYCASKHAVVGLMESIRLEEQSLPQHDRINTCLICPSIIGDTKLFKGIRFVFPLNLISPALKKDQVADRIIQAVAAGESWVVMPFIMSLVSLLYLLPIPLRNLVFKFARESKQMDTFQGRPVESQ